jgi:hypothetical protein
MTSISSAKEEDEHLDYTTSVKLAKHLYENYRWTLVGTVVPTEKTSRSNEDLPFVKLSNSARNKLRRGWFHEAYTKKKLPRLMKAYYLQCTTWKDKKQVTFLITNQVGFSHQGLTVKRQVKGNKKSETIPEPHAHADYIKSMNGVDRNNRDSRDYSTSIRTNWWYLCIFCWAMDRVVHAQHSIVVFLAEQGIGKPEWNKYRDKNQG